MAALRHPRVSDPLLQPIAERVIAGERLTRAEGLSLFGTPDLPGLGHLARWVKERRYGTDITYVINRQVNPTNLCVLSCVFCDFAAKPGDPHAYELTMEQILLSLHADVREVHIVGGLHQTWPYEHYLNIVKTIHATFPRIQIKAWTAVEIDWFARLTHRSVESILAEMQEAGVHSLPGGGAEVFSERVRTALFKQKMGADRWEAIHRAAHSIGLKSNATLLYGHMETVEERVHFALPRELQGP